MNDRNAGRWESACKTLDFPRRAFTTGAFFFEAWQRRRTRAIAIPICVATFVLKSFATMQHWWLGSSASVVFFDALPVLGSFVSFLAIRRKPTSLRFPWLPLYASIWLASLPHIQSAGGVLGPALVPYLILYMLLGIFIQNTFSVRSVFAFTIANLFGWIAASTVELFTGALTFPILALTGIGIAIFLPLHSEAKLAERVVKATHELAEARVKLAQATEENRAKRAFLNAMSHELFTPLNVILGMLELVLDDTFPDADRRHFASRIRDNGTHLTAVIKDILQYAEMETTGASIHRVDICVKSLLQDLIKEWTPKVQEKGVTLSLRLDEPLPRRIKSDGNAVRRILDCLLANALKFTDSGSITIKAQSATDSGARSGIVLQVRDSGCGVQAADLERVFGPFVQGDDSLTRQQGGLGLGLAIAYDLARFLGGRLFFTEPDGEKGSTFSLFLPCDVAGSANDLSWF